TSFLLLVSLYFDFPFLFHFFFNDTATTDIYTLSLHDALPISFLGAGARTRPGRYRQRLRRGSCCRPAARDGSEVGLNRCRFEHDLRHRSAARETWLERARSPARESVTGDLHGTAARRLAIHLRQLREIFPARRPHLLSHYESAHRRASPGHAPDNRHHPGSHRQRCAFDGPVRDGTIGEQATAPKHCRPQCILGPRESRGAADGALALAAMG